jgi:hypothetical protein
LFFSQVGTPFAFCSLAIKNIFDLFYIFAVQAAISVALMCTGGLVAKA